MRIAEYSTSPEVLASQASGPTTRSRTRAARAAESKAVQQASSLGGSCTQSNRKERQVLKAVLHGILKKGGRKSGKARKKVSQPCLLSGTPILSSLPAVDTTAPALLPPPHSACSFVLRQVRLFLPSPSLPPSFAFPFLPFLLSRPYPLQPFLLCRSWLTLQCAYKLNSL